jgi:hypothetical protein
MERPFVLEAETMVAVRVAQARQWFLELEAHPERYKLETHAGFAFTQGSFGQAGARFVTWERFYGLRLALHFELTEVGQRHFRFDLRRPRLPVWGIYVIEEAGGSAIHLALRVGGTSSCGHWFLRRALIRGAIERQIQAEVAHVKASMEALYAQGGA